MNVLVELKKLFLKNILDIMNKHKRFNNIQKLALEDSESLSSKLEKFRTIFSIKIFFFNINVTVKEIIGEV